MSGLVIELPSSEEQTAFNLERWEEIVNDPQWEKWAGRIETDRHGNVIMSPHAGFDHQSYGSAILSLLKLHMKEGRTVAECPISTADGVRVADVIWISRDRREKKAQPLCLTAAPEICVEVLSPRNRKREMAEKKALYFLAGAKEVWFCDGNGRMTFITGPEEEGSERSMLCPAFPSQVELE
jgi:Uma2 family endonuclease